MKKSVAVTVGVVVIAGAWLGSTWYTGKKLETETAARLVLANEQLAQIDPSIELVLSQISFERSLFSSQARYALTGAEKGSDDIEFRLEFDTHYEHGPFPAGALAQGRFMPSLALVHSELAKTEDSADWFNAAQGKTPFTSELLLAYSGDAQFDARFSALKLNDDEGILDFSGADLRGTFQAKTQHAQGTLVAPKLVLDTETEQSGQVALTLADSQLDFDTRNNAFGIQSGTAELRIASLKLRQGDDSEIAIDKLAYGARSSEDEKFMRGEIYLNTGATSLNGQAFGNQSLTIKTEKLDGQALKLVSDAYNRMMTQGDDESMDELLQAGKALLDANPTLALDNFSWTSDKGSSTLAVHSEWRTPDELNGPAALVLAQALKGMSLDLDLNKPMAVELASRYLQATQGLSPEQAQTLATQQFDESAGALSVLGLLKAEGDSFKSRVVFDGTNSAITVNGEALPPEVLMGLLLGM